METPFLEPRLGVNSGSLQTSFLSVPSEGLGSNGPQEL